METEELLVFEEADFGDVERLQAESIGIVRDLILKGNPDLVPELVHGESLAELMESVEPARVAYQRIAESVRAVVPVVPAGGAGTSVAIEELTADGLITPGVAQARRGEG